MPAVAVRVHVDPARRWQARRSAVFDRPFEVLLAFAGVFSGVRYAVDPEAVAATAMAAEIGMVGAQLWSGAWLFASVVLLLGLWLLRPALHAAGLALAGSLLIANAVARIDTYPLFDHKSTILMAVGVALWWRLFVVVTSSNGDLRGEP